MKTVRMTIDPSIPASLVSGWIDSAGVDATSEEDIAKQEAADEAEAMQDAAKFARRVRRRLGLSQAEFSHRIDVSIDTIRNWEQGKRCRPARQWLCSRCWTKHPKLHWLRSTKN